jgi:hypothetical protein
VRLQAAVTRLQGLQGFFNFKRKPRSKQSKVANMPEKKAFEAKPNSKSEKNKPKGGAAKDEERAKLKAKKEAKAAAK